MDREPFGLLELGSNSLKFYLVRRMSGSYPAIQTHKAPWGIAHDFFSSGTVSENSVAEMVACLRAVETVSEGVRLESMIALATGVFREIPSMGAIAQRIKAATGVRVRVISGEDEAKLMAKDFGLNAPDRQVFLFDLGGATTQWALFREGKPRNCGSLPFGAIRSEHALRQFKRDPARYRSEGARYCDARLESLPVEGPVEVLGTGGTVKATAKALGTDTFSREQLDELIERVLRTGPPPDLKPSRQAVFLPGLVMLERILARCDAPGMSYGKASVRDGMAGRLVRLLGTHKREDLHATLLLVSSKQFGVPTKEVDE